MGHGGEDGNLALDHVLLALALGFVYDLGGEFSASLPVVAQPHHSEVAVTNNLQQVSILPFSCHLQVFRQKKYCCFFYVENMLRHHQNGQCTASRLKQYLQFCSYEMFGYS